ncbi:MAG: hypothetical protein R2713_13595 [Ilumatobacteraceae bacterium]
MTLLSLRDVRVTFPGRRGLARSTASTSTSARARWSHWSASPGAAKPRSSVRSSASNRSPVARSPSTASAGSGQRDLRALRRQVQMVFQDPTGALNPRHTIYEAVAEGVRIHAVASGRGEAEVVADALSRAGLRPPERFMRDTRTRCRVGNASVC